jgi:dUTP pyrophosphatase
MRAGQNDPDSGVAGRTRSSAHDGPFEPLQVAVRTTSQYPSQSYENDAGWDLCAAARTQLAARGGRALIRTGVHVSIPIGYAGLVLPRSGLASRHGITLINSPGLVDPGYTGELRIAMINHDNDHDYTIEPGDRIAQLLLTPTPTIEWVITAALPASDRDTQGFGSTGYSD